jgi:hypothetical protein
MYQHSHPPRSAIPKVIGILMIIFASLGLLGGLIGLAGGGGEMGSLMRDVPELRSYRTIELLINVLGLGISALHLYAGVRCIGYKANAPSLARSYAILAMVVTITNAILVFAWAKPILEGAMKGMPGGDIAVSLFGPIMVFTTIISLAWPILVLVLMTRPAAKAACVNEL